MKRLSYDVPRWHAYLSRDSRGMALAKDFDSRPEMVGDELFDRLYSGAEGERIAQDPYSDRIHKLASESPDFDRLARQCAGDADATAAAVESLLAGIPPEESDPEKDRQKFSRAVGNATGAAVQAQEDRQAVEGIAFGRKAGSGSMSEKGAPRGRELAKRIKNDPRLRAILTLAGRFKRIAANKRRERVKHGADEVTDIETGGELARLIPSELAQLTGARRLAKLRDIMERQALQYRIEGREEKGKGPLVVCLDKSGSMNGQPDIWSTAVALALLDCAREEKRPFALLCFDCNVKAEYVGNILPEEALFVACLGGTNIARTLDRALQVVKENQTVTKGDVVLITDGQSDTMHAESIRARARESGVTILGFGIGVEREDMAPWCDTVHAVQSLDGLDDGAASALFGG